MTHLFDINLKHNLFSFAHVKCIAALCILLLFLPTLCFAQQDSTRAKSIREIIIRAWQKRDISNLPEEQNGYLYSGRKNEVITLSGVNANIALKTGRQVFAKVPGVFVYDMDGSGNQLNISVRGLDAHRSWEFNNRQNNVIVNSDMYGYPASHYSAPMESIEKIELVRGTGALEYGAQFGGMINMVTKKPDSARAFTFESVNTAGSYKLLSTYNAVGGTWKKWSYYAYSYNRHSDGYRKNTESEATAQFFMLQYKASSKLTLKAEMGRSKYLYRIPGPLNDSMFNRDPTLSTRSRNYFSPDIYVPSFNLKWNPGRNTWVSLTASALLGNRSSVMFDAFATVPDTILAVTRTYKNRQVDLDNFNSKTLELRALQKYSLGNIAGKLATGILLMKNDLHRRQLGKGSTGSDYDLSLVEPGFVRDLHFKSGNMAFFAGNQFQFSSRFSVTPGLRIESGNSAMSGTIKYYTVNPLPTKIKHQFMLMGISSQYQLNESNLLYGGLSQAYRPVIFKDIIPASVYEQIDKNLKDARGYNAEIGLRGRLFRHLQYDLNYFVLEYKNRMGTVVLKDSLGQNYVYRTNIGDSRTAGMEIFIQYKFPLNNNLFIGIFTSTSYMNAVYVKGAVSNGTENKSVVGNKVESVPQWIARNGIEILYKGFSCTLLHSYTSSSFSDALNTINAPASGAKGVVPAYTLWDFNASLRINHNFLLRAGINNLLNVHYYTKRPVFYPGPGIWPSDGRNINLTLCVKL